MLCYLCDHGNVTLHQWKTGEAPQVRIVQEVNMVAVSYTVTWTVPFQEIQNNVLLTLNLVVCVLYS